MLTADTLGANARAVVGLVLGQSLRLALIGLEIGALFALGLSRIIAGIGPVNTLRQD